MIVLNAELKSMNSNLTYVSVLSSDWTYMQTGRGPGRGGGQI